MISPTTIDRIVPGPSNPYIEALTPTVIRFRRGHEGGDLMVTSVLLQEKTLQSSLAPSVPSEDTGRRRSSTEALTRH